MDTGTEPDSHGGAGMKNKCARLLTAAVVLLMVLSLSGCGKKNDVENGTGLNKNLGRDFVLSLLVLLL